jgi:hypothetical protein
MHVQSFDLHRTESRFPEYHTIHFATDVVRNGGVGLHATNILTVCRARTYDLAKG